MQQNNKIVVAFQIAKHTENFLPVTSLYAQL